MDHSTMIWEEISDFFAYFSIQCRYVDSTKVLPSEDQVELIYCIQEMDLELLDIPKGAVCILV